MHKIKKIGQNLTVLWIPSWYPNADNVYNGDFIFRHALAVSRLFKFDLLFCYSSDLTKELKDMYCEENGNCFRSVVISFKRSRLFRLINTLRYFFYYYRGFKKLYLNKEKPSLIHVHVSYRAGLFAVLLRLFYGIPYIITEHWTLFTEGRAEEYKNISLLHKLLIRLVFKYSLYVMPVSADLDNRLKAYFPFIDSHIIPNVVDSNLFYLSDINRNEVFKFIHVSGGNAIKNVDKIIAAFLRLKRVYDTISLTVIGCYPEGFYDSEYLKSMDINIVGPLQHAEVADSMRLMHSFILFSDYETQSCVSIEALCCGLPVISSRLPCIEEFINETNGILVPPGNEDALYKAMETMILNYDKYDRKKISEDAQAKYNPEVIGKQIVEVYRKVLNKK